MGGNKGPVEKPPGDCWYNFGNNKGAFDLKAPKKSPLALGMVVLAMTMLCGVFICSICMKQLGSDSRSRIVKIEVAADQSCNNSALLPSGAQFVHYPQPITYSRDECICNPVRFFTIVSSQRSGSGWFETLLNSHINVSSNGENFSNKERRSNISSITKTLDEVYNLDWE